MVRINQGNRTVYINSTYIKTITFDEEAEEAKVWYTDDKEVRYFHVESIEF